MYLPPHFEVNDIRELQTLIKQNPLGALIVTDDHGELEINHLPFELDMSVATTHTLRAHIAKANPLYALLTSTRPAYVVFQAEQHYISPNWYASKHVDHCVVPTWNYRVVHAKGTLRCIQGESHLRGILARLTREHEVDQLNPWRIGDAPKAFIQEQLEKIVAIELQVESIVGKFKVSQNRTVENKESVVAALQEIQPDMAAAVERFFPK